MSRLAALTMIGSTFILVQPGLIAMVIVSRLTSSFDCDSIAQCCSMFCHPSQQGNPEIQTSSSIARSTSLKLMKTTAIAFAE